MNQILKSIVISSVLLTSLPSFALTRKEFRTVVANCMRTGIAEAVENLVKTEVVFKDEDTHYFLNNTLVFDPLNSFFYSTPTFNFFIDCFCTQGYSHPTINNEIEIVLPSSTGSEKDKNHTPGDGVALAIKIPLNGFHYVAREEIMPNEVDEYGRVKPEAIHVTKIERALDRGNKNIITKKVQLINDETKLPINAFFDLPQYVNCVESQLPVSGWKY